MNEEQAIKPKIIISYSWTSDEHKQWVRELAERLVHDGVDVILDIWELKHGHDLYVYMERMVTDSEISRVLVICDRKYTEKANAREGGVGTESLIISPEVYAKTDQEKFIPIITEYDENGSPYLPTFLKSRFSIDMSSDEKLNENYETLIRSIIGRPQHKKPALGKLPSYIFDDESVPSKTRFKLQAIKDAVQGNKSNVKGLIREYLREYASAMEDFQFSTDDYRDNLGDKVQSSINSFLPYRDEFIDFILFISTHTDDDEIYQNIFEFFEEILRYKDPPRGLGGFDNIRDNFRFILRELFLYLIAALIKNRRYSQAASFMSQDYFYSPGGRVDDRNYYLKFPHFCTDALSLEDELYGGKPGTTARLLQKRASSKELNFDAVMQADLVLFLRSLIHREGPDDWFWIPKTLTNAQYHGTLEIFARAESKKHFENLKVLLGVSGKQQLIDTFEEASQEQIFGMLRLRSAGIKRLANIDKLDSRP